MANSFHQFSLLPYELRHEIWETLLPITTDRLAAFIAIRILSLPRDNFWGATSRTFYNRVTLDVQSSVEEFARSYGGPSPYAALAGSSESRAVALKHFLPILEEHEELKAWIAKRRFPYFPKLVLDGKIGELKYVCSHITDKEGYSLNESIFWGKVEEETEIVETKEVKVELELENGEGVKAGLRRKRDEEEFLDPEEDFGE